MGWLEPVEKPLVVEEKPWGRTELVEQMLALVEPVEPAAELVVAVVLPSGTAGEEKPEASLGR